MKLRHAVALALVGWYLIVLPVESCNGAFSGHPCDLPPLVKWRTVWTYDSLSACEKSKDVWVEKGHCNTVINNGQRNEATLDQETPL